MQSQLAQCRRQSKLGFYLKNFQYCNINNSFFRLFKQIFPIKIWFDTWNLAQKSRSALQSKTYADGILLHERSQNVRSYSNY